VAGIETEVGETERENVSNNHSQLLESEMTQGSYMQFCPVAMASEVLTTRWTMVLLRELVSGSTRFNDLRRGVPRMSPALLSRRLKEFSNTSSPKPGKS
jgi:DNA-binding HxlR family transcriptional regulator